MPLNSTTVPVYTEVRADLDAMGAPVGPLDLMIAVHAIGDRSRADDEGSR